MCLPRQIGIIALVRSAVLLASMAAASEVGPFAEPEKAFLASTQTSMRTMMAGMERPPLGDVDQDFIGQMIPHHQGAIDMAKAELRYGPHGIWPSGDGSRMYVGLEKVIETARNQVIASIPIGQAPQAVVYVPNAAQLGTSGTDGLQRLGIAAHAQHLSLVSAGQRDHDAMRPLTSLTLFDQGLVQVLQAAVTGLSAKVEYVLGFARNADGSGPIGVLADFKSNAAGAAIVNSIGPVWQIIEPQAKASRRYLVIRAGSAKAPRQLIQVQATEEQSMKVPSIDGLIVLPTQHSVADILARTISIAQTRGITVFAKIDFSGDAAKSNLTLRPTGLIILGNPAAGTPVMADTPTAAIDLPAKILAFEDPDGHAWVAYNDPTYLQRRHGFSESLVKNLAPIGVLAQAVAGDD